MNKYHIPSNSSNPRKEYQISDEETAFLDALLEKSKDLKGEYQLSRLSNGTINVSYNNYPIGKIKLQGRTRNMLILIDFYDSKSTEGELPKFIAEIDSWISYIKKVLCEK